MARYAGQLLAPVECFGQGMFCPLGKNITDFSEVTLLTSSSNPEIKIKLINTKKSKITFFYLRVPILGLQLFE